MEILAYKHAHYHGFHAIHRRRLDFLVSSFTYIWYPMEQRVKLDLRKKSATIMCSAKGSRAPTATVDKDMVNILSFDKKECLKDGIPYQLAYEHSASQSPLRVLYFSATHVLSQCAERA